MKRNQFCSTAAIAVCVFAAPSAHADYVGLFAEPYSSEEYPPPPEGEWQTYRVYAMFDSPDDQLIGIFGEPGAPLIAETDTSFYQEVLFGGDVDHPAILDGVIPGLHFDSYWTIGSTDSIAHGATHQFWAEGPFWTESSFLGPDGAYYRVPTDPATYGVFDPGFGYWRVLVCQFTVELVSGFPGDLWVSGGFQMLINGESQIVSDSAYIFAEVWGACCTVDGCFITTPFSCQNNDGTFMGQGSECDPDPCVEPTGACCIGDGCLTITEAECAVFHGSYMGDGTDCADVACPEPCLGDVNDDGVVDILDLLAVLAAWGPCS